ncbi:hypothetical protein N2152v2_007763 [Parachlorella kessleri]
MNPHLPSGPGGLGSLARFSLLPTDGWQPTQAGDLLGGNSLLGTPPPTQHVQPPQWLQAPQQQGSLVALQEGSLRLNGGEQAHRGAGQHWQGEVAGIQRGGGERLGAAAVLPESSGGELSNAWLLDLLSRQDGAGSSPVDPQHAFGPGFAASAGLGMGPSPVMAVPQDQAPFAAVPLQPRAPSSAAQQPPYGSMTPYLQQSQHRERQAQAQQQQQQHFYSHLPQARLSPPQQPRQAQRGQQQGEAAGNAGLPVASARPGGAVEQSQKQQQEMWRRGLFSEVFEGGSQRAESPFQLPDLGDIEAPDMDDLLMGGLGLDEPFQPLGLPATTSPKPASLAPAGRGTFPASPGQAQQPALQRPGSSLGVQAVQARRGQAPGSEPAASMLGTVRQQGHAASPFMSAQPAPMVELAGSQPAQRGQDEPAADRAAAEQPAKPAQGRGPSKKAVAAKKSAASKRQKAASAAAAKAAAAAAKRARLRQEQEAAVATTTLVEWCTEEEPAADDEMKEPPARASKDATLLQLSPAAALVAAGAFTGSFVGGKETPHLPGTTARGVGHHQDMDTTCQVAARTIPAPGKASCAAPQRDSERGGLQVLGWLFGPRLPRRWALSGAAGGGLASEVGR